jgi:hypothetical protein
MPVICVQEESFATRKAAEAYLLTLGVYSGGEASDERSRLLDIVDSLGLEL